MSPEKEREEEQKKDRVEFAKLPLVTDLPRSQEEIAIDLLERLDDIQDRKEDLEAAEENYKAELQQLQDAAGLNGLRFGRLCFTSQKVDGRRTLDKMLLLENGVSCTVLNSCYKTGKPSVRRTFKRLPEDES